MLRTRYSVVSLFCFLTVGWRFSLFISPCVVWSLGFSTSFSRVSDMRHCLSFTFLFVPLRRGSPVCPFLCFLPLSESSLLISALYIFVSRNPPRPWWPLPRAHFSAFLGSDHGSSCYVVFSAHSATRRLCCIPRSSLSLVVDDLHPFSRSWMHLVSSISYLTGYVRNRSFYGVRYVVFCLTSRRPVSHCFFSVILAHAYVLFPGVRFLCFSFCFPPVPSSSVVFPILGILQNQFK